MNEVTSSKFARYITRSRWQFIWLTVLVIVTQQIVEHVWLAKLTRFEHFATQLFFYGLTVPMLVWWGLTRLHQSFRQTTESKQNFRKAQAALQGINKHLETLTLANRRLTEAQDEDSLLKAFLELPQELLPALGCSLIRFNEKEEPLPPIHLGALPPATVEAWSAHLANKIVREQCACCTINEATTALPCPLLSATTGLIEVKKLHFLELTCNGRLYALLTIYLADPQRPTREERFLLAAMAREMALALESFCLRRNLAILHQLHQDTSRHENLRQVLVDTVEAFEVAGGILYLADEETAELHVQAEAGQPLRAGLDVVTAKVSKVWQTEAPLIIFIERKNHSHGARSILAAPLQIQGRPLGILVLWAAHSGVFTDYHVRTVAIIAEQASQIAQTNQIQLRRECRAMLAERERLAREIHDGLAQTIGYLKLRSAQIADWLQRGEAQRALAAIVDLRQLLDAAYTDAREAIDGLRLKTADGNVQTWVDEIVARFEAFSGIFVQVNSFPDIMLTPEVQAQLQRIIQEAFSNVRRHADATHVWLEWGTNANQLTLKVRDNGCGFNPNDMPSFARHGLQIMEERACLLDATLKIDSYPDEGTEVVVTFPYQDNMMRPERERAYSAAAGR